MDVTLDETHAEVLRELDRQIDLLSNGPQPSLPPFTDDISLGIHNASPNPGGQLGNPIDGLSLADKDLESELWTGDASFLVCADPGNPEVVGRDLPSADGNTNTENVSFNERHIPHIVDEESASMALFQSLQTLQKRIDALEREKTESGAKIQSLENELLGTRQLLFHKQATSESNLIRPTVAPPLLQEDSKVSIASISRLSVAESTGSVERVSAIKDLQSNWVQDARNEVKELRERVEMEKKRQKDRRDSLNANDVVEDIPQHYASSIDNNSKNQRITLMEVPKVVLEETRPKRVEPAPVGVSPAEIEFLRLEIEAARAKRQEFKAAAKRKQQEQRQQEQRQQLFEATYPSTVNEGAPRNNKLQSRALERGVSDITLKETAPVWQRVEGRPKTISGAAQLKNSNRVPQRRSDSSNAIERDLPFVVGQNPGKSYSVTANLQTVYSLLKSHNPALCSVCSDKSCTTHCAQVIKAKSTLEATSKGHVKEIKKAAPKKSVAVKAPEKRDPNPILQENMRALEKEFRVLKQKYDYLVAKYDEVIRSPVDSGDGKVGLRIIGDELKSCIQSMESKRDQMIILKQIISNNLITKKESGLRSKEDGSKGKGISSAGNRKKQDDSKRRPPSRGNASLGLLKNSLVVQNALARAN